MNCKYLAEREAKNFSEKGLPVVILNPSVVLGAGDIYLSSSGSVLWFCKKRFPGYMDGTFNVVDVDDVANGHLLAEKNGKPGERYILANENVDVQGYFALLEKITGVSAPKMKIPYVFAYTRRSAREGPGARISELFHSRHRFHKAFKVQLAR